MSIGRVGAICEVIEIMQISPVRAMKSALIAASRAICKLALLAFVMAGLVPAIHVFLADVKPNVDARDKPGHDEF